MLLRARRAYVCGCRLVAAYAVCTTLQRMRAVIIAYRLVSWLPTTVQHLIRHLHFRYLIRSGNFLPDEPEIVEVKKYARHGDWVVDVGANVGRYTCYMSSCVGKGGRVLAFEPIMESFSLLTENVHTCGATNVSLHNLALSSKSAVMPMSVPEDPRTHLSNYYEAHIAASGIPVLCLTLDCLSLPHAVRLIKIDAEGHDLQVLRGAQRTIQRDRPVIIVEGWENGVVAQWLREQNYDIQKHQGSPNMVALPREWTQRAQRGADDLRRDDAHQVSRSSSTRLHGLTNPSCLTILAPQRARGLARPAPRAS
jgi:FkbM family methyltransferase